MKLTITVTCNTLVDAGVLEEWLVKRSYDFTAQIASKSRTPAKKKKRKHRGRLTPQQIQDVLICKAEGLSQAAAARRCGVSNGSAWRIYTGKVK